MLSDDTAEAFLAERHWGVLVTLRHDGRSQLSNVGYGYYDGAVHVSVTEDRAKARNLRRDPRASLHVTSEDFWTYLVVEGQARLSSVAAEPGDSTCAALLRLYEQVRGDRHPDPAEFDRAMVAERRLELSFSPSHRYPLASRLLP